jgi:hypothetical protein
MSFKSRITQLRDCLLTEFSYSHQFSFRCQPNRKRASSCSSIVVCLYYSVVYSPLPGFRRFLWLHKFGFHASFHTTLSSFWGQSALNWATSWRSRYVVAYKKLLSLMKLPNVSVAYSFQNLLQIVFRHWNDLETCNIHDGRLAYWRKINTEPFCWFQSCCILQHIGMLISRKWELDLVYVYSTRPAFGLW